jgi:hypothetical protein
MSDEYRSQFISNLVLPLCRDIDVDEFENFTATVRMSRGPLFKDMQAPWKLRFSIDENNKLAWSAIERGTEIDCGHVRVTRSKNEQCCVLGVTDPDAREFIETMFPGRPDVHQVSPDENVFVVDGTEYDFDTMDAIQFTLGCA